MEETYASLSAEDMAHMDQLRAKYAGAGVQASIRGSSQEDIAANVSQGSAAEPLFKLCGTCEGTGKQQEEYSIGSSSAGGCRVLERSCPECEGDGGKLSRPKLTELKGADNKPQQQQERDKPSKLKIVRVQAKLSATMEELRSLDTRIKNAPAGSREFDLCRTLHDHLQAYLAKLEAQIRLAECQD